VFTQIPFRGRVAWVLRFFQYSSGVCTADYFILSPGARTFLGVSPDRRQVPLADVMWRNSSALVVTGLPTRQAKTFSHVIATFGPIIAGVAVNQKSVWRHRIKFH
jgi:hypothetical protein